MLATIIILCLLTANLTLHALKHKEPKEGINAYYNFWIELIDVVLTLVLLYFAGVFDCFSK